MVADKKNEKGLREGTAQTAATRGTVHGRAESHWPLQEKHVNAGKTRGKRTRVGQGTRSLCKLASWGKKKRSFQTEKWRRAAGTWGKADTKKGRARSEGGTEL